MHDIDPKAHCAFSSHMLRAQHFCFTHANSVLGRKQAINSGGCKHNQTHVCTYVNDESFGWIVFCWKVYRALQAHAYGTDTAPYWLHSMFGRCTPSFRMFNLCTTQLISSWSMMTCIPGEHCYHCYLTVPLPSLIFLEFLDFFPPNCCRCCGDYLCAPELPYRHWDVMMHVYITCVASIVILLTVRQFSLRLTTLPAIRSVHV